MAHRRDFRRKAYLEALKRDLGDRFGASTNDFDQVLYDPRRLVRAPSRTRSGPGDARPTLDLDQVRAACDGAVEHSGRPGLEEMTANVFDLPGTDGVDACAIASSLDQRFPDQVAPLCYMVTQQFMQPGEDPEASLPLYDVLPVKGQAPNPTSALGQGVRVAVIDTGIDQDAVSASGLDHQSFDPARDLDSLDDPTAAGLLGPAAGHGTFIASLISSVAPGATVLSYGVAGPLGLADELDIAEGVRRAVEDGAHVINLSLGGYPFSKKSAGPTLRSFSILESAIAGIPEKVAVVAAAGNCGSSDEFYPAAFPRVVSVAALDQAGRLWEHSNYGPWVQACARGVAVRGLFVKGRENPVYDPDGRAETWDGKVNFATWTGTSFAAPLVAGQIAVVAARLGLVNDTRKAAEYVLGMSKPPVDERACGRRVLVDLPGQT